MPRASAVLLLAARTPFYVSRSINNHHENCPSTTMLTNLRVKQSPRLPKLSRRGRRWCDRSPQQIFSVSLGGQYTYKSVPATGQAKERSEVGCRAELQLLTE